MGVEYITEIVEGIAFTYDELRDVQIRENSPESQFDSDYWLAEVLEGSSLSHYFFGSQWSGDNEGWAVGVEPALIRDPSLWDLGSEYGPSEIPKESSLTESQYDDLASLSIRILGYVRPVRILLLQSAF